MGWKQGLTLTQCRLRKTFISVKRNHHLLVIIMKALWMTSIYALRAISGLYQQIINSYIHQDFMEMGHLDTLVFEGKAGFLLFIFKLCSLLICWITIACGFKWIIQTPKIYVLIYSLLYNSMIISALIYDQKVDVNNQQSYRMLMWQETFCGRFLYRLINI